MVAAGARFVTARHEAGATTMADAYARLSGEVAAVTVHQGCGFTNTLTGLTEAAKSRTPLVVVAADVTEERSNFYVDQDALARAVGAVPITVDGPAGAHAAAVEAVRAARSDRRTVVLNLPLSVQAEEVPEVGAVPASGGGPDHQHRRGGDRALRGAAGGRGGAGVRRRPWGARCPKRAGAARRAHGRAAGDQRGGQGPVRGEPVVARRVGWLRVAARGGADRGVRPRRRVGLRPEHVDDAPACAGRPRSHRGAGRPRPHGARSPPAGRPRRVRRRGRGGRPGPCAGHGPPRPAYRRTS